MFSWVSHYNTTITVCISLQVLQLEAPAYVVVGGTLGMECLFDFEEKKLYKIQVLFHAKVFLCKDKQHNVHFWLEF